MTDHAYVKYSGLAGILILAITLLSCQPRKFNDSTEADMLASVNTAVEIPVAQFGNQDEFFFGLATAPAHVEDNLADSWLEFARAGRVAAFNNQVNPEKRLNFWTDPDVEIRLAAETGVRVFRMGVDWGRLMPHRPGSSSCGAQPCADGVQDRAALARYREIVGKVRASGMKVMLTLFHHSLPKWTITKYAPENEKSSNKDGWLDPQTIEHFANFSRDVVSALGDQVDYWITFNEPSVYALLTYAAGMWPPGYGYNPAAILDLGFHRGNFHVADDNMAEAHRRVYTLIHKLRAGKSPAVGIAHNISYHTPADATRDAINVASSHAMLNLGFPDATVSHMDFLGLNYYGEEILANFGVMLHPLREYSESGRAVNPNGLAKMLVSFHERYNNKRHNRPDGAPTLPIFITENGVSDDTDLLRQPYLVEHLLAIAHARKQGVPVKGYISRVSGFRRISRDHGFRFVLKSPNQLASATVLAKLPAIY